MDNARAWWMLTDGEEVIDKRFITDEEAEQLNREADIATDGNWWWFSHSKRPVRMVDPELP